jgi:guanylate kinase
MKGKLFVVSGPSGAGKSTITKLILKEADNLFLSTSATTRAPRAGEVDGKDYYFMTKEQFEKEIAEDNFVEHADVHGNYYGTLKREIDRQLNEGKNVLLEIDVQGGEQVKKKFPDVVLIFFKAPSEEELERRLRGRGTDSEEVIAVRLKNSLKEMEYESKYDKVIINETIEGSIEQLKKIIEEEVTK